MAKLFVSCGANVIITGRNESKLKEAFNSEGNTLCRYLVWDISITSDIKDKLTECTTIFNSPIDILVNNAGEAPSKFWDMLMKKNGRKFIIII
jgi:3-oxoacyl-[acyl-carrier protein] reductase